MKRRRTETSFSPFFFFSSITKRGILCAAVADQQHIQLPPSPDLLFGEQQPLTQTLVQFLWIQRHQTAEGTGHQVRAGNAAEKAIGIVPHLQRIENIQQVFLQRIELVEKGKPDQHIAVNNVPCIIGFIAASVSRNRAERKARHIGAGPLRVLVNVDYTVLQTVIAAVIKIEIQPLRLKERTSLQRPHRGRRVRRKRRLIAGQLPEGDLQRLTDLI